MGVEGAWGMCVVYLVNMPREQAQAILDGADVGGAASRYGTMVVEKAIRNGKIKPRV